MLIVRGGTSGQPYVLVVEDEVATRRAISDALTENGLEIVAAEDAAIALAICRERDPAVIVLDLELPRRDGEHFVQAYRKLPRTTNAQILVISGTADGAETAATFGGFRYFANTFSLPRIVTAVRLLLTEPATTPQ